MVNGVNKQRVAMIEEVLLDKHGDGLQCAEKLTKCMNAVCFIYCENDVIRRATGFFTKIFIKGKEHKVLATNSHVIPSPEVACDATARFFFEGSNEGKQVTLQPDLFFVTDKVLDYTFVGCDSAYIENELHIEPLEFKDVTANVGGNIFIFQHPRGEPKKVSYQKISKIDRQFLYYQADTDVGSSGSPVFMRFQLIAIHCRGCELYNKGVLCGGILQHLNEGTYPQEMLIPEGSALAGRKRENMVNGRIESSPEKKKKLNSPAQHPTELGLQALAKDIVNDWKSIGRRLGLPNTAIVKIHKDNINYDDITEKAFAMLLAWKEMNENATLLELRSALEELGLVATAQKHC